MNNLDIFKNAKKQNRLSHLYLLTGKPSLDKLALAYEVCYLVLQDYDDNPNLKSLIFNNEYLQVFHIEATGNTIKKEQIIALQQAFAKTSLKDGPRFYVIENVDLISTQAANSLLKFMEEPDNNMVYGILTTSNLQSVLPTITSRSQIIRMRDTTNEVANLLIGEGHDHFISNNIAVLTSNSEHALTLVENDSIKMIINYLKQYFINFTNASFKPIITLNNEISNIIVERDIYKMFLELLLFNYTDLLKFNLKQDHLFSYDSLSKTISSDNILKDIELIKKEIKRQNAYININLSVDNLMLQLKRWN